MKASSGCGIKKKQKRLSTMQLIQSTAVSGHATPRYSEVKDHYTCGDIGCKLDRRSFDTVTLVPGCKSSRRSARSKEEIAKIAQFKCSADCVK